MRRIALLTDFGTRDPYVASMRGVMASRCNAPIEDLTHDIAPFDVFEAAWFLSVASRWWPPETIFVCVVDPGVGSDRRILAAERGPHLFLAPDNGLLTLVEPEKVFSVEDESLFLPEGSTTFHGRDRFAPVAAALVNEMPLDRLGPRIDDMKRIDYAPPVFGEEMVTGTVMQIDRFGNAVTDIERSRIAFETFALRVHYTVIKDLRTTYDAGGGEPFLIVGSNGTIEISVGGASASEMLKLRKGDRVEITPASL